MADEAVYSKLEKDGDIITVINPQHKQYENEEGIIYDSVGLLKGSYDLTIQYKTDADNNFFTIRSNNYNDIDALYNEDLHGWLSSDATIHTSHIRSYKNSVPLYLQINYCGDGDLCIERVTLTETNEDVICSVLRIAFLLLLIDLCILNKKRISQLFSLNNYRYTLFLLLLILLSSLPVFAEGVFTGHDTLFHVTRIEGLKEAILSGQFPPKMHSVHLYGYGYATGQMYPQLFLYPSAVMRIIGFNKVQAHDFLIFMVNCITVPVSFYSYKQIFRDRYIALTGTMLYVLAPYRILNLYYRDAVGEYCAMIGFPLIALGLYSFISKEYSDKKPHYVALAAGYSIVLESHVLSSLGTAFFSLLLGLVFIRRFFTNKRYIYLGKTFILTICVNAAFLVPFLDYMRLPMNTNHFTGSIGNKGIDAVRLFTFNMPQDSDKMPLALGYGLIFATIFFIIYLRSEKEYRVLGLAATALGILSCIMSLHIFPWQLVEKTALNGVASAIQFPWRFLAYATIAFTISGCVGMVYLSRRMSKITGLLILGLVICFSFINMTDFLFEKKEISADLKTDASYLGVKDEYLLEGADKEFFLKRGEMIKPSSEDVTISEYSKLGSRLSFKAVNIDDETQIVDLPLTMYPGYCAEASTTGKLDVTYGENGLVRVLIPGGLNDEISVYFGGKWYWKAASVLSIITVIYILTAQAGINHSDKWGRK